MKIRNGFVSNSSSSSFIINDNISVRKLAIELFTFYKNDRNDVDNSNIINNFIINNNNLKNEDTPIVFRSVNEDTYIYKNNNKIYVETCNNVNWYDILDKYSCLSNYDNFNEDAYNKLFYSPEYDYFLESFSYCYQCNSVSIKINNKKYCLKHNKRDLAIFDRKKKIKNIL